jgi:hypothetical protein
MQRYRYCTKNWLLRRIRTLFQFFRLDSIAPVLERLLLSRVTGTEKKGCLVLPDPDPGFFHMLKALRLFFIYLVPIHFA